MAKTLGLDIGTNSIGWCLIEEGKSIQDIGVRIFPVGVKEDDYAKSGSEISKNSARRNARGIRRLYDRYKLRRKTLRKLLLEFDMLPEPEKNITAFELFELRKKALDGKIDLKEIGRIFLLLNQRRGFKSSKKDNTKDAETKKQLSETIQQMEELNRKVVETGCRTVGEYFFSLYEKNKTIADWHNPDEPVERIRKRFVFRKLYEIEFDEIWKIQNKFYPEILTDENYKKIKDNCIFYQRPLKSQKHLVSKCRFEPKKKVCPRSSFEYQEFRIWQTISNIRVTNHKRFRDKLTLDEKRILGETLNKVVDLSHTKIKDLLKLKRSTTFNEIPDRIKGNSTNSKLINALGKDYIDKQTPETIYKLWHTLFFANDEEWLEDYAMNKLGMTTEQAEKYSCIDLEPDYSNISSKAIKPILAYMQEGHDYAEACLHAGYHHSLDDDNEGGDHDKIIMTKKDNLRNPLVQQAVSETIRLVNAIMKEHGRPDKIRVEFARSLKKPKDVREKMKRKNDDKEKRRNEYREFLSNKLGLNATRSDIIKFELWLEMHHSETDLKKLNQNIDEEEFKKFSRNIKSSDKEKYQLWLECGRISPYTGNVINLSKLFSPEIEIEHIVPYSKCMDDSFLNKTLSEKSFNEIKGNQTPYDYFQGKPDVWEAFKERVKNFSDAKQERFMLQEIPDGFLNSQLTNTAYIALQARKKLKMICKDVRVTNGQATSNLRRFWGLNDLLNKEGENKKTRYDHRHHAIDALVIASTTENYINKLSRESQFDFSGKMILKDVKFPYPNFKLEASKKLNEIFVSFRNKKRLITSKTNKFIHSKNNSLKPQKTIQVRGSLHEETFYGSILNPHTKEENFVVRKPLETLSKINQVDKIVDPVIRKLVLAHIEQNGGEKSIKQAVKTPMFMISKDGKKKIPVKKVRMIDNAENMIQLRPKENPKLFVSSGNNFAIGIYENEKGKRIFENLEFFNAVLLKKEGKPVFSPMTKDSKFLFSLTHNDLVVVYKNHPDEIDWNNKRELFDRVYRVVKFGVNRRIFFTQHNLSKALEKEDEIKVEKTPDGIKIQNKCIKIYLTLTGKIKKADD